MGVNHSSSCHAGSSCTSVIPTSFSFSLAGAYTGSMKDGNVMQPCAAAKVILLDGRVLRFTCKVRASQVLAGFRHHCLCPLDSANLSSSDDTITTFFKPVSLRPDDLLRPSSVYILLPRRTFRRFADAAAAAAAATCNAGNPAAAAGRERRTSTTMIRSSRVSDVSGAAAHSCGSTIADAEVCSSAIAAHHRTKDNRSAPRSHSIVPLRSYPIRSSTPSSDTEPMQAAMSSSHQLFHKATCSTLPSAGYHVHGRRHSLDIHHESQMARHSRRTSTSSSCIRRCKSWRPRLQAINEVHVY